VLWGAAMVVDLAWPRVEVYGEELRWSAVVVIIAVVCLGLAWFLLRGRHRLGTLAEHAR
jgi:hypothetical protein